MSRTVSIALAMTAALCVGATGAYAHPRLQASNPAPGAKLNVAPKEIRMTFSEGLVAPFTGLELKNNSGKVISTSKLTFAAGDARRIVVPIGARLTTGSYTVIWHAVSVDTHRISGSFTFKVVR
ncbi:MAG: copper homeostasis periplasmic binding protein CopC [Burkholderiales bacterium]